MTNVKMIKELHFVKVKCDGQIKKCRALYGNEQSKVEIIDLNPLSPKSALQSEIEWENKLKKTMALVENEQ